VENFRQGVHRRWLEIVVLRRIVKEHDGAVVQGPLEASDDVRRSASLEPVVSAGRPTHERDPRAANAGHGGGARVADWRAEPAWAHTRRCLHRVLGRAKLARDTGRETEGMEPIV